MKMEFVLVLLSAAFVAFPAKGAPSVVVDPQWVNYGQTATVTVTFDPPCPNATIYRRGLDAGYPDECHFGPKCPVNPARPPTLEVSVQPNGNWLRFTGVHPTANGRYYAFCPSTNSTYEGTIAIGVKPRIIAVEFGNPQYGVQANLTRWQNGQVIPWNSHLDDPNGETIFKTDYPIPMPTGESFLTFIVGMGVDPHNQPLQSTWPRLFTFEAPDFDDDKEMRQEHLPNYIPFPSYPMVTRYRYRLNRNTLVNRKVCSLKSLAVASLTSDKRDKAVIQLDFIFDPTVSNLTVKNIAPNEEVPVGHACDCLFTCHVSSCPVVSPPLYDFEWSFPQLSQFSPKYNIASVNRELMRRQQTEVLQPDIAQVREFVRGNVVGFPAQYLLNATICREMFLASRDLMRTSQPMWITCRVAGGQAAASRYEVKVFDFMEKSFRDECKTFRRPQTSGNGRRE